MIVRMDDNDDGQQQRWIMMADDKGQLQMAIYVNGHQVTTIYNNDGR